MNRITQTLAAILLVANASAQTKTIPTTTKKIGTNLVTNTDITSTIYVFPERVDAFHIDSARNTVDVQTRALKNEKRLANKGEYVSVDQATANIKWGKTIDYRYDFMTNIGNSLFYKTLIKSHYLDANTGEELWSVFDDISITSDKLGIGIGYRYTRDGQLSNTLQGIQLSDGKTLWDRDITREHGWNDITYLNDSVILVASSGLHTINLRTGKGWDYDVSTGNNDYSNMIATNAAGVVLGIFTGSYVYSTSHDVISSRSSNILVDSSKIYITGADEIICLGHEGGLVWSSSFNKNKAGRSKIYVRNDTIYMINSGLAMKNGQPVQLGNPFVAAYDKNTGKELFFKIFAMKKTNVTDFILADNDVYLLFEDRVLKLHIADLKVSEKQFDTKAIGFGQEFADNIAYIQSADKYIPLKCGTSGVHFLTGKWDMYTVDPEMNIKLVADANQYFANNMHSGGYHFISKGESTIIVDKDDNPVASLEGVHDALVVDKKLYFSENNQLHMADLKNILID